MSEPLLTLPSLALVIAPYGSGKSSLVKYLILEQIDKIACVVLFSNTGLDAWEQNYSWLNKMYVYDHWDDSIMDRVKKLGKRIKKANPNHHVLMIWDDSIGMSKSLFKSEEFKKILVTLRHYNISILISTHQLQTEVSTVVKLDSIQ